MLQHLCPVEKWTFQMQDATPAQFRAMLPKPAEMDEVIKLAVKAGRAMAKRLAAAGNTVANLDPDQIEAWRRRWGVPANRTTVMLAVAWSTLQFPRGKKFPKSFYGPSK